MSELATVANGKKSPVNLRSEISFDEITSLLEEYTKQVNAFIDEYRMRGKSYTVSPHPLQDVPKNELVDAIEYITNQLGKLVDLASAYREFIVSTDGQRFRIDLLLFNAELALKRANRYQSL